MEGLAIREGLSVARPVWDADGIDLLLYAAQPTGRVKAVGLQVKAYSGPSLVVYTKYADATVMAYYVNAASQDPSDPPGLYVMTAARARALAISYTTAHARRPSSAYDPNRHDTYRWNTLPQALGLQLQAHRVHPGSKNTLRRVCRL